MKAAFLLLSPLGLLACAVAGDGKAKDGWRTPVTETVISPGVRVSAKTPVGTIAITAVDDVTRSYTLEGATRTIRMVRRAATTGRARGSLGIFSDAATSQWPDNHGITRGYFEEGQQHLRTLDEATGWISERRMMPYVYRNDGLMVGWDKDASAGTLTVEVWQILVDGKKPKRLPGSEDDKFVVGPIKLETARPQKALADDALEARAPLAPAGSEVVMSPGMRITAATTVGTIAITAVDELTRAYTWDGATRAVNMCPRGGGLGIGNPGAGEHWRDHHGITGCVTLEGQQHFQTVEDAVKWVTECEPGGAAYRDDGLFVAWDKDLGRKQLNVVVWQMLIDGKKPKRLPGSQNNKVVVETVEMETVPLAKAVSGNDLRAVTGLLAQGADPNVKNSLGVPVLFIAVRNAATPIVHALLKNGADPNVRDADTDSTPLWEATGRPALVETLLAAGADLNAAPRKAGDLLVGRTPLMFAAEDGFEDTVRLLLEKGADVNARTPIGKTALSIAKARGLASNRGTIRLLEAAGAKR